MASRPCLPLIAVIGATGTGKSDLAVEIARRFNGEVVNSDAIQLYAGLPIITNKITQREMKGVTHHLLGCIGVREETWTVGRFVERGVGTINDIRSRGKLPVLVGGTHYYTQSLLFQDALAEEAALDLKADGDASFPILQEATEVIHARLKEVDPVMADRWHPNERRKIQRSLEIYLRTGKPASKIYEEQRTRRETSPGSVSGVGMRYPTLVLWVHANKDVLYSRLDGRVDKMLDRGLLKEVEELTNFRREHEASTGMAVDQSRGIWVSIGYKEFLDYQDALSQGSVSETELEKLKISAVERTQAATRQYANRQLKWIRIKLLNALIEAGQQDKTFLLDGTDISKWETDIVHPATDIVTQFLEGSELPQPSSLSSLAEEMLKPKREYDLGKRPDLWEKKVCDTCGTVAVTENDWMLHVKSRAHRRAVGVKKKQEATKSAPREKKEAVQADVVDVLESYLQNFPTELPEVKP